MTRTMTLPQQAPRRDRASSDTADSHVYRGVRLQSYTPTPETSRQAPRRTKGVPLMAPRSKAARYYSYSYSSFYPYTATALHAYRASSLHAQ